MTDHAQQQSNSCDGVAARERTVLSPSQGSFAATSQATRSGKPGLRCELCREGAGGRGPAARRLRDLNALVGHCREKHPGFLVRKALSEVQQIKLLRHVVYEDDDCVVVVKPQGIATQKFQHSVSLTVLAGAGDPNISSEAEGAKRELFVPRLVHRLDAETGGLMVAGKTRKAVGVLSEAFQRRLVRKRYMALLRGHPDVQQGVVEGAIEGDATNRVCAVDLWPVTGYKHQLRRHMAALGTPVLGDRRYMGKEATCLYIGGQGPLCLWATEVSFPHPSEDRVVTVSAKEPHFFHLLEQEAAADPLGQLYASRFLPRADTEEEDVISSV